MSTPTEAPTFPVAPRLGKLDLFTWKDPVRTGKVFGAIVVTLFIFKKVNLFNVFFHLSYLGLLLTAAVEYVGRLVTGQGFVTKYKPTKKSIAKQFNDSVLPAVADANVKFEEELQKIVYAHDIETTLKAAGVSYVLYKVTSWFSLFTLLSIAVVVLFTFPAIYVRNKKEIDAAVAQYSKIAKDKSAEYGRLAHKKAAPHIDNLVKKSGPVGSFISSKIPTRTAGSTVGDDKAASYDHATATTTGASKFPDVPNTATSSTLDDVVTNAKSKASKGDIPTSF